MLSPSSTTVFQRRRLILLTDQPAAKSDLITILSNVSDLEVVHISSFPMGGFSREISGLIVEIDLTCVDTLQSVREVIQAPRFDGLPRLFVISRSSHRNALQAWALGATDTLNSPFDEKSLVKRIKSAFPHPLDPLPTIRNPKLAEQVSEAYAVMTSIYEGLPKGRPIVLSDIISVEKMVINALYGSSLHEWLSALKFHHKQSYRHSLFTGGLAAAFSNRLGFRKTDQRRLTRAALLFDVGNAFVPAAILNKSGRLTNTERMEVRLHPQRAYEVLAAQGEFSREVLDVILHHHELLDGSGYPHGLKGDEICDIVRMITIIDIYAALIEPRAHRPPFGCHQAIDIMKSMGEKLDQELLSEFQPVALSA